MWNSYVDLGLWVDVMLIVFVMVFIIGKMVNGIVDNMLIMIYFFVKVLVFVVLVMDLDMFVYFSI